MAKLRPMLMGENDQPLMWTSGIPRVSDLEKNGVEAIVNVNKGGYSPELEAVVNGRYAHYWIPDGKTVKTEMFMDATQDAINFILAGHPTLIHCRAGQNRSCTTAALVMMIMGGFNGREAREYVQERRPNSIVNPAFANWLDTLESR